MSNYPSGATLTRALAAYAPHRDRLAAFAAALEATVPVQDAIDSYGRAGVVMPQGLLVGGKTNPSLNINGPVFK